MGLKVLDNKVQPDGELSTLSELAALIFGQYAVSDYNSNFSVLNAKCCALMYYVLTGKEAPKPVYNANKISRWDLEKVMRLYAMAPDDIKERMDPQIEVWKKEVYGDPYAKS